MLLLLHLEMNDVWEEEGRKEGMEHRKGRNGSGGQQTKELSVCTLSKRHQQQRQRRNYGCWGKVRAFSDIQRL